MKFKLYLVGMFDLGSNTHPSDFAVGIYNTQGHNKVGLIASLGEVINCFDISCFFVVELTKLNSNGVKTK